MLIYSNRHFNTNIILFLQTNKGKWTNSNAQYNTRTIPRLTVWWLMMEANQTNIVHGVSSRCPEQYLTELISCLLHNLFLSSLMEHVFKQVWRLALKTLSFFWNKINANITGYIRKFFAWNNWRGCVLIREGIKKSSAVGYSTVKGMTWPHLDFSTHL